MLPPNLPRKLLLRRFAVMAPALLLMSGCAYDYAAGYAPQYPPGYDSGLGSGDVVQPGDLFGGQNVASTEVFFGPLARYGQWADTRFGYAFIPAVRPGWRPYVNGRWGDNRLWISNDPWGWATDHYGRWGFDEQIGWVWVPDTEWAPSWVAWRENDDVAGWAPIPPGVRYSVSVGFGSGYGYDDWNSWYGPSWVWVQRPYLYRPGFGNGPLPWQGGRDYWRLSQWQRSSGWNGQQGYRNWNRGGDGRPNGNGYPGGNRPLIGRPDKPWPDTARPGQVRPDEARTDYGRPPRRDGEGQLRQQYRQRPDGTPGQWQGRPGQPVRPYEQVPRAGYNGQQVPRADNDRQTPRAGYYGQQAPRAGYDRQTPRAGYDGQRAPRAGYDGQRPQQEQPRPQSPPVGYGGQPRPDTGAMTPPPRGSNGGNNGGGYRPPPPPPAPRAEPPAQRPPAPARESRDERPQ